MRIDFSQYDLSEFNIKYSTEYGEKLMLITPSHMGVVWTKDNLIFRSSIWTEDGYLVSPSFPKFFNWGEKDNIIPPPDSLVGTTAVEKIDGSTLIISRFKDQIIMRTRGTFNVNIFENASEMKILSRKYPNVFSPPRPSTTFIYEWYSPSNKIVLDMGNEPKLWLIAAIRHDDYSLVPQEFLDKIAAEELDNVPRPKIFKFESVENLLADVKSFEGKEGVCLYYNNDQRIKKIKSTRYLTVHAFKSDLSINNLLEVYVEHGRMSYQDFFDYIANNYDYECAIMAQGDISKLCDANKELEKIVEHMRQFAGNVSTLSRKEAAAKIISAYGNTNRSGMVFSLLDKRPLDNDAYKKLLHQILPK